VFRRGEGDAEPRRWAALRSRGGSANGGWCHELVKATTETAGTTSGLIGNSIERGKFDNRDGHQDPLDEEGEQRT
jgi:hypothetical protein